MAAASPCKAGGESRCGADCKSAEAGARCGGSTDGKCARGADCKRGHCGAMEEAKCNSAGDGKCACADGCKCGHCEAGKGT
jgi:hypothetical protein